MKNHSMKALAVFASLAFGSTAACAAVGADQAGKLGKELTAVGAVQAANAEGTIPAWEGGITAPPSGYKVGDFHLDPFAADTPTLQITAQNYRQHPDKLTEGQQGMFAKYPTFRMDIYPTRRSASSRRALTNTAQDATPPISPTRRCVIDAPMALRCVPPSVPRYLDHDEYKDLGRALTTSRPGPPGAVQPRRSAKSSGRTTARHPSPASQHALSSTRRWKPARLGARCAVARK